MLAQEMRVASDHRRDLPLICSIWSEALRGWMAVGIGESLSVEGFEEWKYTIKKVGLDKAWLSVRAP
jgi:hypothetical protein